MSMDRRAFLARLALLASATTVAMAAKPRPVMGQQGWTPPIGIPDPGWGITNPVRPALPSPWTQNTANFYYVRQNGGNSGNGFPGNPRGSIPNPIPAGAVVVLDNTATYTNAFRITANGTSSSPCFIVGSSLSKTNRAQVTITTDSWFDGTYCVIEYLDFFLSFNDGLQWGLNRTGNSHLSFRHNIWRGDGSGQIGHASHNLASYVNGGFTRDFCIFYDCEIRDIGLVNATSDIDAHAIKVDSNSSNVWVVDCTFDRIGGDSVQTGPQGAGTQTDWTCHHIYMGRCVTQGNRQSGGWVKHARDVVYSQNTIHNMNGSTFNTGTPGTGLGLQEGADRVWYLYNYIYDIIAPNGQSGINMLQNLSGSWEGVELYAIGNVIHNVTNSNGIGIQAQPRVSDGIYVVNNTIVNVPYGIYWRSNAPSITVWNNIIDNVSNAHLLFDTATVPASSSWRNNLFGLGPQSFRVQGFQGTTYTSLSSWQTASGGRATNNINVDPTYVDGANPTIGNRNFALVSGSRGIDEGNTVEAACYARFQALYGLDIRWDFNGRARFQGLSWDIGAYEFGSGGVGPTAPSGLQLG